jgi:hypothetical protein
MHTSVGEKTTEEQGTNATQMWVCALIMWKGTVHVVSKKGKNKAMQNKSIRDLTP